MLTDIMRSNSSCNLFPFVLLSYYNMKRKCRYATFIRGRLPRRRISPQQFITQLVTQIIVRPIKVHTHRIFSGCNTLQILSQASAQIYLCQL